MVERSDGTKDVVHSGGKAGGGGGGGGMVGTGGMGARSSLSLSSTAPRDDGATLLPMHAAGSSSSRQPVDDNLRDVRRSRS